MSKVSIIIPAYNVENYIEKCLDSILNQSYKDLEIIVVDDGSTDSTLKKIEEKAKIDKRISIISQKNKGVIEARKSAYKKATGQYILYVDGDDWIDLETVEKLKNNIEENNSDIVCFEYFEIFDNKERTEGVKTKSFKTIEGTEFLKYVLIGDIVPMLCCKFLRKSFLEKNNIEFPNDISYAEDLAYSCSMGCDKPKVSYVEDKLYMYYQREGSITKQISPKLLEISEAMRFIKRKLEEKGIYNQLKDEFDYAVYLHCLVGKKKFVYDKNNPYGKEMFNRWKSFNIDIKSNKYIKEQMKQASSIGRYLTILASKHYFIGNILN